MKPSIIRLRALEKQLYAYLYAMTVIDFDAETVAPEGSADGRAEATEVLSRASFDLLVNDGTATLLKEAAADAETEQERAEVRNLQRQYDEIARIPADEYAAFTKLCSQSVPAWTKAKRTNDFSLFAPYLEKLIAARRAQARYFAPDRDPYEVLLDRYEKGLTIAQCDEFFATLRETIVPLLADIQTRGKAVRTDFLDQEWPIDAQRSWSCGALTRPTAIWPRASTLSPPSSGAAMCASRPTTCPGTSSRTSTASPTRAATRCMS